MENFKGILESITETMKSLVSLVQMVAELIREKKWVELICLILAVIIVGWFSREAIKSIFKIEEFPQWFVWGCLGGILLFSFAVLIAVFNKPKLTSDSPVEEQVAIKGLRPFTQKDAEVFSKLERNKSINACLSMLQDRGFRIGILWGESGCGKSSFIQAGLMSKLTTEESPYRGIYIKFSDKSPIETVTKEIIRPLKLNSQETKNLDFLGVCEQGIKAVVKPLILFFDQFEQVFVHRYKFPDGYEQFIDSLKQWYEQDKLDVKILMCLRSDLFYFQSDIQNKLDYPLYSSNSFELKKFSAEEATNILEVIAKIENIDFERDYIKYLFETNFIGKDHLISPVDLQILSLVISSQNISEKRAFKKTALQKIGEVEGLLYQYLEERLKLREKSTAKSQTEKLMKVLLEFVDGNELTRAGAFTIKELQEKLNTISPQEIREAINWLALERLITPSQQEEETAYELAHEKMIPAVMKLSGKILPKAYKANELLNKKVRMWMENHYSPRYLLGIRELWFIESHKRYLIWGNKERQKQRFLQQSKRGLYRNLGVLGTILLLLMTGWGWLHYTTPGQLWQIRRDLAYWGEKVRDDNYQSKAAIAFAKDGQIKDMKALLDQIDMLYPNYKTSTLQAIAQASSKLSNSTEAVTVLKEALTIAQQIDHSGEQIKALSAIAQASSKLSNSTEAVILLKKLLTFLEQGYSPFRGKVLPAIVSASTELSDTTEAVMLLEQLFNAAQDEIPLDDKATTLTVIAKAYIKLSDSEKARTVLKEALTIAQEKTYLSDKARHLTAIAEVYIKLSDIKKAINLLAEAFNIAQQLYTDKVGSKSAALSNQSYNLTAISQAYIKFSDSQEAVTLLKQALTVAKQIDDPYPKVRVLEAIAQASSQLSNSTEVGTILEEVLTIAQQIDSSSAVGTRGLSAIAYACSQLSDSKKAANLLRQAFSLAIEMDYTFVRLDTLTAIIEASSQLSDTTEAVTFLKQALTFVQKLDNGYFYGKSEIFEAIIQASSELSGTTEAVTVLKQALTVAQERDNPGDKASELSAIAEAYIKLSDTTEARTLLKQALILAQEVNYLPKKAELLTRLASAYISLSDSTEAVNLLKQALTVAQQIDNSNSKGEALTDIAKAQANLQRWGDALHTTKQCPSYDCRVESLSQVLTVYAELKNPELKEDEE